MITLASDRSALIYDVDASDRIASLIGHIDRPLNPFKTSRESFGMLQGSRIVRQSDALGIL